MNYSALKTMIESIINTYKCPSCKESITDNNIDIIGAAGKTINLGIECKKCKKNSMIKVEVMGIDLTNMNIPKDKLELLQSKISELKGNNITNVNENIIKDELIVNLSKDLKVRNLNVIDLFNQ